MKRRSAGSPVPRLVLLVLLGALALSSCARTAPPASAPAQASGPAETRIVIFHSNDIHGRINAFSKIAALLAAEKAAGADVFYVSAGDNFTGDPVIDRYDPQGEPMIDLLGRLGLAVICPGNHEFDYGLGPVRRLAARVPMVSANIQADPGVFPELRPWTKLKTKNGTTLVVFGLIQIEPGNGLPSTHPDKVKGLRFSDPLVKALELKGLRAEGQVLIALTHIGHDQDLLLAERMPEIDVIIGGHSHTRVDPAVLVDGVLVAQAGSGNAFLGRIDLRLKDGRIVEKTGRLIDLGPQGPEDGAIRSLIARYRDNPALARVVARTAVEITGPNALGSLMTDAIRSVLDLDIAFQNNGGIRLPRLPRTITLRDVYTLEPFSNAIVRFDMTAAEIRSLIRTSFEKRRDIDLQVSGMTYLVRTDAAKQIKEIVLRAPDGAPLREDRTYKVGLSSYIASAYEFDHRDPGRSLQTTTADVLIRFLEGGADLGVYREARRAVSEIVPEPPRD